MFPFDSSGGGSMGTTGTNTMSATGLNGFGGTNGQSMANTTIANGFGGGMGMGNSGSTFGNGSQTPAGSAPISWWDMANNRAAMAAQTRPFNTGFVPQSQGGSPVPYNPRILGFDPRVQQSLQTQMYGGAPQGPANLGSTGAQMFQTNPFVYNNQQAPAPAPAQAAAPAPSSVSTSPAVVDDDPTNNIPSYNHPIPQQGGYGNLANINRYAAVNGDHWWQSQSAPLNNNTIGRLNQPMNGSAGGLQSLADQYGWGDPRVQQAANQARQTQWNAWDRITPSRYARGGMVGGLGSLR